ncbi:hypothetical protein SAMN05192549_110114 [Duganella sacchari]|uniref:DUF1365 domain-containing protein n=1 Tax=Duganella sacchari TaxID=551987 RepID=A0A1M7R4H2_9BURK|nr:DUF1365 domain-containing protein [Duganella sacchari]SHN40012.1 hypothetical protein SAMN05192549_110114 [Duganella sacchari]
MKSPAPAQLVHARVMHARLRPVLHRFVYPVFYVRLNLAQLERCQSRWFGIDRRRPLSLRTRDYGPRDGSSLEHWMRALLAEHDIAANGEIWLQTFPRVLGHAFNPVSFWHCHDRQGRLRAVLAEVNNTFGETHRYLLQVSSEGAATCIKQMHVSPFCQPTGHYHFRFHLTGAQPRTSLDYHDDDGLLIRTTLSGRAEPMRDSALAAALLRYPLLGLGIVFRIHWQALRLWLKKVPFFRKPPRSATNITVHEEPLR